MRFYAFIILFISLVTGKMIHYLARGMERITNLSILSECCLTPIFQIYHCENKFIFNDIMMRFALYWTNRLSWIFIVLADWLSADRHVTLLGHIILIPIQPIFTLSPHWCVLSEEAIHTNFIVFGLNLLGLETTIYRARCEYANHYTTDASIICKYFYPCKKIRRYIF
jgi:hypothetical protein